MKNLTVFTQNRRNTDDETHRKQDRGDTEGEERSRNLNLTSIEKIPINIQKIRTEFEKRKIILRKYDLKLRNRKKY